MGGPTTLINKLFYKYLGPTTIHLQHEFLLLTILCIFTSASFYTTYHSSKHILSPSPIKIGSSDYIKCYCNEFIYILLSTVWLGRHLLHRIICTTEVNTSTPNATCSRSSITNNQLPSSLSTVYKIWIWICCGGQYSDIPSCPIQFALHDPSSSVHAMSSMTRTNNVNSNNRHSSTSTTLRNIIQTTNVKSSAMGVLHTVDHHHHHHHHHLRQINNKSNSELFQHRKTPPIHRLYIVQVFVIVPMIVLPISITKYIISKLSSRKRSTRGYYDSDDEDDDTFSSSTNNNSTDRRRGNNSNNNNNNRRRNHNNNDRMDNHWDDKHNHTNTSNDYYFTNDDNDNDNDAYIKIHFKTQNQVNTRIDTLWNYTPSIQFMIWFTVIIFTCYVGIQFYYMNISKRTFSGDSITSSNIMGNGGAGSSSSSSGRSNNQNNNGYWRYNANTQGYQRFQQNRNGIHSTALNAELMAQRFEMKQKRTGSSAGRPSGSEFYYHYGMKGIYTLIYSFADKIGMSDWTTSFYSPWGMIYMMSFWGIVMSLCLFGRIMLPLPDLIAGGRDTWNGKGSGKSNKQKRKGKSWSESYMTITTGNRFNLYYKILFVRIIENLIVCAILPQSLYVCKATGHCNIEPTIFEIGNPTVIQRDYYNVQGSRGMFDNLIQDRFAGYIIAFSVVITSAMMMLGQIVILDKSSLSLEAHSYIQGNKNNVIKSSDGHNNHRRSGGGRRATNNGNTSDNLHLWNDKGGNSGSGLSNDKKKHILSDMRDFIYEIFSKELGALSTSRILSFIFCVYSAHALLVVVLAVFYSSTGRDWYPLVLTLIAIFTAAGGSDVDTADFDELEGIAGEINAAHGK